MSAEPNLVGEEPRVAGAGEEAAFVVVAVVVVSGKVPRASTTGRMLC